MCFPLFGSSIFLVSALSNALIKKNHKNTVMVSMSTDILIRCKQVAVYMLLSLLDTICFLLGANNVLEYDLQED